MNNDAHNPQPADSHGALDLSAAASAAGKGGTNASQQTNREGGAGGISIPLIDSCDDSSFEAIAANSQKVPVVLVLWAAQSLESKQLLATLEELAREKAGAFQLVEVDVQQAPRVAQAFQVQVLPTTVALVGARPVPLFQGAAAKEQIAPVIEDLLRAAGQMGVTGRIAVSGSDIANPSQRSISPPSKLKNVEILKLRRLLGRRLLNTIPAMKKQRITAHGLISSFVRLRQTVIPPHRQMRSSMRERLQKHLMCSCVSSRTVRRNSERITVSGCWIFSELRGIPLRLRPQDGVCLRC